MLQKIFKSSSLYAVGTIARTATSIIMLPIYTRYLAPEIYGTAELLNLILDLTVLLLGARVTIGMFKFYADAQTLKDKHRVLTTTLWLGLIVNFFAICVLWLLSPFIANFIGNPQITEALRWFMFTIAFGTIGEIGMGYFRVNDQAGRFLVISLIKLTVQVSASIYFIVYKELGLWGIIYSALIGAGTQALILLVLTIPVTGLRFSIPVAKNLFTFSLPIIMGSFAMYYMTFGDRYFLQVFHDTTTVGIYALGYKFGFMLLALVWGPFMSYWGAKQYDHAKAPDGPALFSQVFSIANYILWAAATGMLIFAGPVVRIMAEASYHSAINLIPLIVLAYVFQGWTDFHRFGLLESKNTRYLNIYTWISAVIIGVLYVTLIPAYGAMGAAAATFITMLIRFTMIYRKSQQYFTFPTNWVKISGLFAISGLAYGSTFVFYDHSAQDFIIGALLYVLVIAATLLLNCAPLTMKDLFSLIKYPSAKV